jgi:sigma-B regulation protein RsbU (phosphoserine phosphatase)
VFLDNLPPASYFTLAFAVFDPARARLVHANAGHPPVLSLRPGGAVEWLSAGGPAVGLLHEDVRFETAEVRIEPGDLFVYCTDGITEAEDASGSEFGRERLAAAASGAAGSAAAVVAAVHDAVLGFRAGRPRADDATVIAVRVPDARPRP